MSTSIHRPERCLPAQGWTVADTRIAEIPTGNKILKTTRLHDVRSFRNENGELVNVYALNYYWFVGHNARTPSHYQRTWIDIRDRVLRGENQQWAYVTTASTITKDFRVFGTDEKQTDDLIRAFISNLVPQIEKLPVAPGE
jgi:hypothetical protein